MLTTIEKIAFIFLLIAEDEFALAVLEISCPVSLVYITIGVFIDTVETLVVSECAGEGITVEESKISFDFDVVTPCPLEDSAFTKVVSTLALLSSLLEIPTVHVLIGVFQRPSSMRQVIQKPTRVCAAVLVGNHTLTILQVVLELPLIGLP